jgi:DNA polymerase III epsilon subunit-like protein
METCHVAAILAGVSLIDADECDGGQLASVPGQYGRHGYTGGLMMERVAVLDFETTGLSLEPGNRPTETAIALVESGRIVDRFQSLMNPSRSIPSFVTQLIAISNDMVKRAPAEAQVLSALRRCTNLHRVSVYPQSDLDPGP